METERKPKGKTAEFWNIFQRSLLADSAPKHATLAQIQSACGARKYVNNKADRERSLHCGSVYARKTIAQHTYRRRADKQRFWNLDTHLVTCRSFLKISVYHKTTRGMCFASKIALSNFWLLRTLIM